MTLRKPPLRRSLAIVLAILATASRTGAAPPPDAEYGVCEHPTFWDDQARSSRLYARARKAGIAAVRTDFHWIGLNPGADGSLDFSRFDRAVATAERDGVDLLPILTSAPADARPLHDHLDLWRSYVDRLVSRYGDRLRAWEIWNEHNFPDPELWGPEDRHAANYVQTLKAAHQTIKAIDPDLVVVYGGTAHVPLDYIESTLKLGAGAAFDVMNVHPYGTSTAPEAFLFEQIRDLKALLARYGLQDRPIWATEIGWPTVVVERPWLYDAILPKALATVGIDPESATLGVISDVENGWLVQSPAFDLVAALPRFRTVRRLRLEEIAGLDVRDCPVLVPCREEIFPAAFDDDLVDYVRRGGTIILPEGIPFGYDKPTRRRNAAPRADRQAPFHIDVQGYWSMGIEETREIEIPGVEVPDRRMTNGRFLGERRLEPGDRLLPLAFGVDGAQRRPFAGVYRLGGSLKGNVVVVAARDHGVREQVDRETQACFLARAYLILLSEGVDRVYWYKLSSSGVDADGDREANFGVLDRDQQPKPAYQAYTTLVRERPPGSSRPTIVRRDDGVYQASWTRPDGLGVVAVWTVDDERPIRLSPPSPPLRAVDLLGRPLPLGSDPLGLSLVASPRVTYVTFGAPTGPALKN